MLNDKINPPINVDILNAFGRKHRTIYVDVYGLPDPLTLSLAFTINNYDDVALYFKARLSTENPYWSFAEPLVIGSIGSGGSKGVLWDSCAQRSNPNATKYETIKLTVEAYTDNQYTNLKWTYTRIITIYFLHPYNDFLILDVDNFDEGDTEGWELALISNYIGQSIGICTDYVLSPPYSLGIYYREQSYYTWCEVGIQKNISVPACNEAYASINVRFWGYHEYYKPEIRISYMGNLLMRTLGYPPTRRWMRFTVPLTPNSSGLIRLWFRGWVSGDQSTNARFDDIRFFYR